MDLLRLLARTGAAAVLAGAVALPAAADPTSVVNAPTANILKPRHFQLTLQQDLAYLDSDEPRLTSFLTEFGVAERVELGVDWNDIGHGNIVEGDVKFQLRDPARQRWGAAVGVFDVGLDLKPFYYGVATTSIGQGRLHAGVGGNGHARALVAAEVPLWPRKLDAIVDWISGPGQIGVLSAGVNVRPTRKTSLKIYWQHFNQLEDQDRIQLEIQQQGAF